MGPAGSRLGQVLCSAPTKTVSICIEHSLASPRSCPSFRPRPTDIQLLIPNFHVITPNVTAAAVMGEQTRRTKNVTPASSLLSATSAGFRCHPRPRRRRLTTGSLPSHLPRHRPAPNQLCRWQPLQPASRGVVLRLACGRLPVPSLPRDAELWTYIPHPSSMDARLGEPGEGPLAWPTAAWLIPPPLR